MSDKKSGRTFWDFMSEFFESDGLFLAIFAIVMIGILGSSCEIRVMPENTKATETATVEPLPEPQDYSVMDRFLDAIRHVETGGEPNGGIGAIGDGGASLGPYQISRAYWQDAVEHDPSLARGRTYADVGTDDAYSREVIKAYFDRYRRDGDGWYELARYHNGGPRGPEKTATIQYAEKVMQRFNDG